MTHYLTLVKQRPPQTSKQADTYSTYITTWAWQLVLCAFTLLCIHSSNQHLIYALSTSGLPCCVLYMLIPPPVALTQYSWQLWHCCYHNVVLTHCTFPTCRIVSSLDKIADTINLPAGDTLRDSTDTFDVEISHVELSAVPTEGYAINFGKPSKEECVLPKALFDSFDRDVVLSGSLFSQTAIFRGKDATVTFASKVFSITVIGESVANLAEPVTLTFEKSINVSPCTGLHWTSPLIFFMHLTCLHEKCLH